MGRINNVISLPLLSALLLAVSAGGQAAEENTNPPIIKSMQAEGLEVLGQFDAPSGLRGYAGLAGGQPLTVYATADGQYALVGMLINAKGEDVGAEPLQRLVAEPMSKRIWSQIEASHWIADGQSDAPRVVYAFSDPNCPYCNRFWKAARPWVDAGKVQLRHIMVGVIRADSAGKAAAMFTAASPSEALERNERSFADGGIKPAATVPAEVRTKLDSNAELMSELEFQGTPGILFRDEKGIVQKRAGMPSAEDMVTVLGPR
jgi:thiol:disulfide interchange protein DsbG